MRRLALLPVTTMLLVAACSGSSDPAADPGSQADSGAVDETSIADETLPPYDAPANEEAGPDTRPGDTSVIDAPKPDAGPPPGFDPRTWTPTAKGLWIWYFSYLGLTAAEAAQKAKDAGVGYVLIKSGQDANFWSTRYTEANLKEFTSRGMRVFAWPYVTPADVTGSIDAVVKAIDTPGTDGIVLDVEVEFEGAHGAEAKALCTGIRGKRPKVWLGFTSFGWPQYHSGFPWAEFDAHCGDVWMPQVYWSDRGVSWTKGYDEAVAGTKSVGIKAPLWMIESNDDIYGGGAPSTADLNSFFDKAGAKTSLWEFPAAGLSTKLSQLNSLHWKNP